MLPLLSHLLLTLLLVAGILLVLRRSGRHALPGSRSRLARLVQRWRPRTPDDCPQCREHLAPIPPEPRALPPGVRPWREGRSRRGAPRRITTEGFACRSRPCPYYDITDAALHALVADGHTGRTDRIQRFCCQACGHTRSARCGTALAQLKTPPTRIGEVLSALCTVYRLRHPPSYRHRDRVHNLGAGPR
jgi:hypothetical protein